MKKKKINLLLIILSFCFTMQAQFAGGDGSEQSPYLIENAQQLNEIRNHLTQEVYFLLQRDIDLTDWITNNEDPDVKQNGWLPIDCNISTLYSMYLDGGGFTIKGLFINRPILSNVGLFGKTKGSISITNLHIKDCLMIGGKDNIGGLIGVTDGVCNIKNCSVSGTITSSATTGLLIGYITSTYNSASTISKCSTSGIIKKILNKGDLNYNGGIYGGVVGFVYDTNIQDCRTDCIILSEDSSVGGIAGRISGRGSIKNCYASGYLSGEITGGIVGVVSDYSTSSITNCVAAQKLIDGMEGVGRISGQNNNASFSENYALNNMRINGETITGNSGGIHGGSKTEAQLNNKSTYDALGWDVASVWKIENGVSSPYLTANAVPANVTTLLKSNTTTIEGTGGKSASSEVWIKLNSQKAQKTALNNGRWEITLPKLSASDIITVLSSENGKRTSLSTYFVDYLGDGTESSPFLISTASGLDGVRYKGYYAHYALENDIDLKDWMDNHEDNTIREHGWYPIGNIEKYNSYAYHKGFFIDGNGFKIKNLVSKNTNIPSSLFGKLSKTAKLIVKNLTIEDCYIVSEKGDASPFGAYDSGLVSFENCHVSGSISGVNATGLVFSANNLIVKDCSISANIKGVEYAGGIAYEAKDVNIDNVHIYSFIKSNGSAAGLITSVTNQPGSEIRNSSVSSYIEGKNKAFGFVNYQYSGEYSLIENCYSSSIVKGQKVYGFSDSVNETIKNSYVQGIISGEEASGVGVLKCYNTVSALSEIKGLGGNVYRFTYRDPWAQKFNNCFALQTMLVNKVTVKGGDEYQNSHGLDASLSQLYSGDFYTSTLNWDFANIWKIDDGKNFPYFKQQTAPPTLTTDPTAGTSTLTGASASGVSQIIIRINDNLPINVTPQGTSWSYTLNKPLQLGDAVLIHAQSSTLLPSYALTYSLDNKKGLGTEDDPILISNAEELNAIRSNLNAVYKLTSDIDLTQWIDNNLNQDIKEKGWLPIGYLNEETTAHLKGKLIGNGHKIKGLRINRPQTDNVGLFGAISNIENVVLDNVTIIGRNNVGAVAGALLGDAESCYVLGNIQGQNNVGGVIGDIKEQAFSTIYDCSFTGYVQGNNNTGGIVGSVDKPLGYMSGYGTFIEDSRVSAIIEGNENVGGIIGKGAAYSIDMTDDPGCTITIENCYSTGTIKGNKNIGGIGSRAGRGGYFTIESNYSSAILIGKSDVGGLGSGRIRNSVAANKLLIENSSSAIGRITPYSGSSSTNNYAYKDMLVNYETVVGSADNMNGLGKTMAELVKKATYTGLGWSDEVWTIKEGATLPYHISQVEAPVLSTTIAQATSTINGTFDNVKGTSVMIQVNSDAPISADISGSSWTVVLKNKLAVNDALLVWTEAKDKQRSYAISELVTLKGVGTEDEPYLIHDAEEFNSIRLNMRANYSLANDINLADWIKSNKDEDIKNNGWLPIGDKENQFVGTITGAGHSIKGLQINRPEQTYTGLFGYLNSSKTDSLTIIDADVVGGDATGILAGAMYRNATNIKITGKVSGLNCVGGLVGLIDSEDKRAIKVRWNSFDGTVSGYDFVGGLIGALNDLGYYNITTDMLIRNNATNGDVYGIDKIGGLIGSIENDYSRNKNVRVEQNYSSTIVKGNEYIGGLIGYAGYFNKPYSSSLEIKNSYATGVVEGTEWIGGIVGYTPGYNDCVVNISNSYAANYLKGDNGIGGISGAGGIIKSCYAMNPSIVFSGTYVGRISPNAMEANDNYFYENTKLFNLSNPGYNYIITAYGSEIPKSELMKQSVFASNSWDFDNVWSIWEDHSYPYFSVLSANEEEPDRIQLTPPVLTSNVEEGLLVLSGVYNQQVSQMRRGQSSDNISVWVKINSDEAIKATVEGGVWKCHLQEPLKMSDIIKIWSSIPGLDDSYATYDIVGDNQYTSINNSVEDFNSIVVFPNPVTDILNIKGLPNGNKTDILIFDMNGRTLVSGSTLSDVYQVSVANLPQGIYFAKIVLGKKVIIQKIIKK